MPVATLSQQTDQRKLFTPKWGLLLAAPESFGQRGLMVPVSIPVDDAVVQELAKSLRPTGRSQITVSSESSRRITATLFPPQRKSASIIANPGYNADRAPVNIFAGRFHTAF
jgi:hypothetical protein